MKITFAHCSIEIDDAAELPLAIETLNQLAEFALSHPIGNATQSRVVVPSSRPASVGRQIVPMEGETFRDAYLRDAGKTVFRRTREEISAGMTEEEAAKARCEGRGMATVGDGAESGASYEGEIDLDAPVEDCD